jgi:hypothetical protein
MNTIETRKLNDAELEAVTGGMTCAAACVLAITYLACAAGLALAGNQTAANKYIDKAEGVAQGGCF